MSHSISFQQPLRADSLVISENNGAHRSANCTQMIITIRLSCSAVGSDNHISSVRVGYN